MTDTRISAEAAAELFKRVAARPTNGFTNKWAEADETKRLIRLIEHTSLDELVQMKVALGQEGSPVLGEMLPPSLIDNLPGVLRTHAGIMWGDGLYTTSMALERAADEIERARKQISGE